MNDAVVKYAKSWTGDDEPTFAQPCLEEITSHDDDQVPGPTEVQASTNSKVLVTCQGYGQDIALPCYNMKKPNVDYFKSDLNIQLFNICHLGTQHNSLYLYDERMAGKDSSVVNSLRWKFHTCLLKDLLQKQQELPQMCINIMDNCIDQNKSELSLMFDAVLSILLYNRVANFYLLPGHSHMRADNVTGLAKASLKGKNIFLPTDVADSMNTIRNMNAEVVETGSFYDWTVLKNYFNAMPSGYVSNYMFEFSGGDVIYRKFYSTPEGDANIHSFTHITELTRNVLLHDLLGLGPGATLTDIVRAPLKLRIVEERILPT